MATNQFLIFTVDVGRKSESKETVENVLAGCGLWADCYDCFFLQVPGGSGILTPLVIELCIKYGDMS